MSFENITLEQYLHESIQNINGSLFFEEVTLEIQDLGESLL